MTTPDSAPELGIKGSASAWNEKARAFAVQLQKARTQRHMTPWELAEQCRLSVSLIQDMERARPVEQHAIDTVCAALSLPIPTLQGDPVHTFALLVRQRRDQARLKQYQLAILSGLSSRALKDVERATRWPRPETCVALLSVRALHLKPEDIAPFVTDLDEVSELAQSLRQLTEDRISKNPKLIGRTHRRESDKDEKDEPESGPSRAPNPTKPRPPVLFTLRVYVDGSILFTPSLKARRKQPS